MAQRRQSDPPERRPKTQADKWTAAMFGKSNNAITWMDADPEDLQAAVAAVTEDGAAILLSKTSDGGALSVQILNGTGRHKIYPANQAELNDALRLVMEVANSSK